MEKVCNVLLSQSLASAAAREPEGALQDLTERKKLISTTVCDIFLAMNGDG